MSSKQKICQGTDCWKNRWKIKTSPDFPFWWNNARKFTLFCQIYEQWKNVRGKNRWRKIKTSDFLPNRRKKEKLKNPWNLSTIPKGKTAGIPGFCWSPWKRALTRRPKGRCREWERHRGSGGGTIIHHDDMICEQGAPGQAGILPKDFFGGGMGGGACCPKTLPDFSAMRIFNFLAAQNAALFLSR